MDGGKSQAGGGRSAVRGGGVQSWQHRCPCLAARVTGQLADATGDFACLVFVYLFSYLFIYYYTSWQPDIQLYKQ